MPGPVDFVYKANNFKNWRGWGNGFPHPSRFFGYKLN
jgi:hypothetical protein